MKRKEIRSKTEISSCTIHYRKYGHFWAIVVMPNNFKVDNYYHGVHVHPDREIIPIKDPDMIYNIIYNHILREKELNEAKLRKELGL
jgi:DNA mismatch repair ATPase MutL